MAPLEERIAEAIRRECEARYYNLDEFCDAYGFTVNEFNQFLQDAVDTADFYRRMDEYYQVEQEKYD